MTDGADLLSMILAEPAEDVHRLKYADWLQEHGDEARAEFIRVQCELARGPEGIDCESFHGRGERYDCLPTGATLPEVGRAVSARCGGSRWTVLTGIVCAWFQKSDGRRGFSLTHVTGETWKLELSRRECELWSVIPSEQFLSGLTPNACWRLRDEPLRERQHGWIVRRGFVDEAKLPASDWLAHADAILAAHPVRRVKLTTSPDARDGWEYDGTHFRCAKWPGVAFELPP